MEKIDLFSDSNPFYKNAFDLPNMSPISYKYTGSSRQNTQTRDYSSNKPYKKFTNFEKTEDKKEKFFTVEYRKNLKNEAIWLENFGNIGLISQQTNFFIKPDLKQMYESAFSRLKAKYGLEKLKEMKKSHLYKQKQGTFSDFKAIKMASLCTFNPDLEIIKPTNYLVNYYYILMSCKALGYLEYIFEFCKISLGKDYKAWVIPQDSLAITMDLSGFKEKYTDYELLESRKTKENLQKIIELVRGEASEGIDFMAMITSISNNSEDFNKEIQFNDELLWNISLATNLLSKESWFITKIYTNFYPKTNEYLFMIYSLFETVYITKPSSSSLLSEEKFLVCHNYNEEIGGKIGPFLQENFEELFENKNASLVKEIKCMTLDTNFIVNIVETLNKTILFDYISFFKEFLHNENILDKHKSKITNKTENELFITNSNMENEHDHNVNDVENGQNNTNIINASTKIGKDHFLSAEEIDKFFLGSGSAKKTTKNTKTTKKITTNKQENASNNKPVASKSKQNEATNSKPEEMRKKECEDELQKLFPRFRRK